MTIFQAGVPRSGNLWMYRTIQKIFEVTETPPHSIATAFRDSIGWNPYIDREQTFTHDVLSIKPEGVFWEPTHQSAIEIQDIDHFIAASSHIWTHQPFCDERQNIYHKFDKIIYILRDPRDVLISNSKYLFTDRTKSLRPREDQSETSQKFIEEEHFKRVHGWIRHVGSYLKHAFYFKNMHFVFYERLLADFDAEFEGLCSVLDFSLNKEQRHKVKQAVSFQKMHQEKPEHVRKGTSGQWESTLTTKQIENISQVGGPFLQLLGYGVECELNTLPQLPSLSELSPEEINQVIAASGKVRSRLIREQKQKE